jgi:SAM-dependent methyltransferase
MIGEQAAVSIRSVGFYREQVVPRLVDRMCGARPIKPWRERAIEGLTGRVVEIGFGSGLNVGLYPPEVDEVLAVEPAAVALRLSTARTARSSVPVRRIGLDGQAIALDDDSCDSALSTFTLCTIPDVRRALGEVRRVLRPGARFHFLEHGLSPDPSVATWQRRLEPFQRRLADGCHLTREPDVLIEEAGFALLRVEHSYAPGPKPFAWFTVGVAEKVR